ncbi:hypothetical protein HDU96_002027 [Phlyctochytrium bullatum]|nr:hypothetical protein HDU96_002027 [Phlyctochytrium bullatum]
MYRLAAEHGDPDVASSLAHLYLVGDGVSRSPREAFRWFRQAANAGEPEAQYMLGLMLRKGEGGVGKNLSESIQWLRNSARQGHTEALFEVGIAYESGIGVPIDFDKAQKWFAKAAKSGHELASQKLSAFLVK